MNTRIPDATNNSPIDNFTMIPNEVLRSPELSAKAKSILFLLLSNREGWQSHFNAIVQMMKDGPDSIRSGLTELEKANYLQRLRYRNIQSKKFVGTVWCYTNKQGVFNLEKTINILAENGLELDKPPAKTTSGFSTCGEPTYGKPISGKSNPNNTNYNNTNYKKTKKDICLEELEEKNSKEDPNLKIQEDSSLEENDQVSILEDHRPSIQERNIEILPIAEKLAAIIKTTKNINTSHSRLLSWANEIRKLNEVEGVPIERIQTALAWYEENVGGQYIPVIESGASLRSKFINLEAAMQRDPHYKAEQHSDFDALETINDTFGEDMGKIFVRDCYSPAQSVLNYDDEFDLVYGLIDLYEDAEASQKQHLSKDLQKLMPSPLKLVSEYIKWIRSNDWMDNPSLALIDIRHNMFSRFCREQARKDNLERHPLTGKSYLGR